MIMWKVISVIVLAALGFFGAKKLKSSSKKRIYIPSPNEERYSSAYNTDGLQKANKGFVDDDFDLSKLKSIFNVFSIQVSAYDALYHLLNAIEKKSYIETIKVINDKIETPRDLIELHISSLPEEPFSNIIFEQGTGGPYVKRDYIVKLCKERGVSSLGSTDELVKNLIVANAKSGMNHFDTVFGFKIQTMREKIRAGEDVTSDFANIKAKMVEKVGK